MEISRQGIQERKKLKDKILKQNDRELPAFTGSVSLQLWDKKKSPDLSSEQCVECLTHCKRGGPEYGQVSTSEPLYKIHERPDAVFAVTCTTCRLENF